eukprot:1741793-Lingulodinium_polyedra.AAC.1
MHYEEEMLPDGKAAKLKVHQKPELLTVLNEKDWWATRTVWTSPLHAVVAGAAPAIRAKYVGTEMRPLICVVAETCFQGLTEQS